ncbi:MAG: inositol monophosphatase [bacterium]|nr:inositol monophosphatase [bacterium]
MSDHLEEQLFCLRELVLAAGGLQLDCLGRIMQVEAKGATEFVTDVDRRVEELMLEGLAHDFPEDAVVAEESGLHAGSPGGRTWYVDPLDGTTNYAHGYPIFAVSAGCVGPDGLELGAVFLPYLDELYLAHRGGGAILERPRHGGSLPLETRRPVALEQALLATGFPYVRDQAVDRTLAAVGAFLKAPCHGIRRGGSAAADLVHVAAGKLDGYFELRLRPWDTAGGTLIAREAGAIVTDLSGAHVTVPDLGVVAAAPGLHARMLEMLAATAGPEKA